MNWSSSLREDRSCHALILSPKVHSCYAERHYVQSGSLPRSNSTVTSSLPRSIRVVNCLKDPREPTQQEFAPGSFRLWEYNNESLPMACFSTDFHTGVYSLWANVKQHYWGIIGGQVAITDSSSCSLHASQNQSCGEAAFAYPLKLF